jgi:phenylalanyl-tRNA synthetase alpha chain
VNPEEVASQLHENERKILMSLRDEGSATTVELSTLTGLSRDAVEKACAWAETKGVLSFREEVTHSFNLTEEGRTYAEGGLPEKRLIKLVSSGKGRISELKDDFPDLSIALVWVRRNNWAKIDNGQLELMAEGKKAAKEATLDERLLKDLNSTPADVKLDEGAADRMELLLRRGLVERDEHVERNVEITDLGRSVLPQLESISNVEVITQLTPEMLSRGSWRGASFQRYDVTLPVPGIKPGKRHFVSQVIDYIRRFWVELGFKEMTGEHVELSFWNFDASSSPRTTPQGTSPTHST